jgi:hypothetical protein
VETARNDSILGRKLSTKWDMDGGGYEWYKGTIVQMEDEHVVVHYEEDGSNHQVPYPSANSKLVEEGEGEGEEEKTNSKLVNEEKTSKYMGVSWHKKNKKWYARITRKRRNAYLGSYEDEHEAARAYAKAYDEANTCKGKVETARNDSILGRKLSTKWDIDGGGYEWYKGTIVQMEDEHVVVHYEEDGSNHQVPYPSANSKLVEEGEGEEEEEKTDSKLVNGREETRISLGTFVSYCDNEAKTYHGSKVQRKFAPEHAVRWPRGKLQKMTAAGTGTKALWGRLDEDDSSVADGDTSPLSPLSSDDDDDAMQGVGRGCTTGGVDSDAAAVATDMKRTPPY